MAGAAQDLLPEIVTAVPGPRSRQLAARLERCESPDTTFLAADFPIFWERARGANVWDVDGNRYVDLVAAFGVASLGHAHPAAVEALTRQAALLVHGMGDVHPSPLKVQLAERLGRIAPGDLSVAIFGLSGSDAIEAALKTAAVATGRPGAVAFTGCYHGLGYGALALTWRRHFRAPFEPQLNPHIVHVPYPGHGPRPDALEAPEPAAARAVEQVEALLHGAAGERLGAVVVEPILGRGGIVVPHPSFLRGLREVCTRTGRLLVVDEILTGLGRTGRWFACEHAGVVPDLLCVGKSLAGGLPLSACIGSPDLMRRWGRSEGEARHTSTFLGSPLASAAALGCLDVLEQEWPPERVAAAGEAFGAALAAALHGIPGVTAVRGLGFLWGVELGAADGGPDAARAGRIVRHALRRGFILLAAGSWGNVLELAPPFILGEAQRRGALAAVGDLLQETSPSAHAVDTAPETAKGVRG